MNNYTKDFSFLGEELATRIKSERDKLVEEIQLSEMTIEEEHKKLEESRKKLETFDASLANAIGDVIPAVKTHPVSTPAPRTPRIESMRDRPRSLKVAIAQIAGWDIVNVDYLLQHLPEIGWTTTSKNPRHIILHTLANNKDVFERIPGRRGHYRVRPEFLTRLNIKPPKTGVRKTHAATEQGGVSQAVEQMQIRSMG